MKKDFKKLLFHTLNFSLMRRLRPAAAFASCTLYFTLIISSLYAGKYAGLFITEGVGGKPQGMGEAYTSIAEGAEGMLWNPAGLAFGRQKQISLMTHKEALLDTQYNFFGYLHALKTQGMGLTFMNFNGGQMEDISLTLDGTATQSKTIIAESGSMIAAGYALRLSKSFGLGLNLKFIQNTLIEKYSSGTPSADFGALFRMDRVSLGVSGSNLFGNLKFSEGGDPYSLSPVFRAGLSYKFLDSKSKLIGAVDAVLQDSLKVNTGIEFLLSNIVAFRMGFKIGDSGDTGLSAGMGLKLGGLQLDYGMLNQNTFGLQHKINLAFNFGTPYEVTLVKGEAKEKTEEPKIEKKEEKAPSEAKKIETVKIADAEKLNVAILNFTPQDPISPGEAAFITEFVRSGMINSGAVRVVDKQNMEMVLSEQGFQQTGCTSQECVIQMGKIMNVRKMITGNFGKLINRYVITVNVIDVETGEINFSDKVGCTNPDDLENIVNDLVNKIAKFIVTKK